MKRFLCLCAGALLSGCAAHPDPIIDTKGVNMARYEADLEECRVYSDQVKTYKGAAKGAVAGAAVGGAVGAIKDDRDTAEGAGVGAVLVGAQSANEAERTKQRVVKNCLRGRGYRVLN